MIEGMGRRGGRGVPANTHMLNHLLTAYARGGRVDEALALLPEMGGPKWPRARPDTVRFGLGLGWVVCLFLCIGNGQHHLTCAFLNSNLSLFSWQITYNILIHACVGKTPGRSRVGTALALAEEMRAKGVKFDR